MAGEATQINMDTHPLGATESSKTYDDMTLTKMDNQAIRVSITATGVKLRDQVALQRMYPTLP